MELEELKSTWQKEKEAFQNRIILDEAYVNQLAFDKTKGAFDRLMSSAIMGRNFALIYMSISLFSAFFLENSSQRFLVIIGGLAMFFSFLQHRTLKRPVFDQMNTLALQKAIAKFRIHIAKNSKYDTVIVAFWFSTIAPVYLGLFSSTPMALSHQLLMTVLIVSAVLLFSRHLYSKWDQQLRENETLLTKAMEFEAAE